MWNSLGAVCYALSNNMMADSTEGPVIFQNAFLRVLQAMRLAQVYQIGSM
jgi:hypothetical protein